MKAAFVGMTKATSKKELVKATLDSLVYQIADVLTEFQHLYPQIKREIRADGGMILNTYLMQRLSNITQRKVKVAAISELSAMGSAMNALNHINEVKSSETYLPDITQEAAETDLYEWSKWIKLLSQN